MSDFDTRRVGEIAILEERIRALQAQVVEYRESAERWTPRTASEVGLDGQVKISLMFGGKAISATMSAAYLAGTDLTTATTSVVETLCSSLVADRLRPIVQPEVERAMRNAQSLREVGKW